MIYAAVALLGFVITFPGNVFFWAVDTISMMHNEEVCRPGDQSLRVYLTKGHWTEAPWRPVCKEE